MRLLKTSIETNVIINPEINMLTQLLDTNILVGMI